MILRHSKFLLLLLIFFSIIEAKTVIEDGEDGTTNSWRIVQGSRDDISNIYDTQIDSRVIELNGGGSYKIGATGGDKALNIIEDKSISWKMKTTVPYTIYIIVQTTNGLRYLFYVSTPSRGLKHGIENGIHHGLGKSTIDGRWRTITRDLEADLKDAEPNNKIISVNGFIYSGGNGGRLDDILLYTPQEIIYQDREIKVEDEYKLDINNRSFKILQWKFKGFGGESEILDERGTIRDIDAFEFRVIVTTTDGERDLIYTLGENNLGLIENGKTIHHALGDDRAIGSVWSGDNPINELGLWQSVTRNLDEDIKDFEPNNSLIAVNSFEVHNSGLIDDVKMLSSVDVNISQIYESKSVGIGKIFLVFQLIYLVLILIFLLKKKKIIKKL
jgi:hypothetical protein